MPRRGRLEAIGASRRPTPCCARSERRMVLYHMGAEAWRDTVRLAWAKSQLSDEREWRDLLGLCR